MPKPIPDIAPAWVPPPTWALPVSVPSYQASTRGHPPTWASPVSIPESLNPCSPDPSVSPCPLLCFPLSMFPHPGFLFQWWLLLLLDVFINLHVCLTFNPCLLSKLLGGPYKCWFIHNYYTYCMRQRGWHLEWLQNFITMPILTLRTRHEIGRASCIVRNVLTY